MKKILVFMLALSMMSIVIFTGCGGKDISDNTNEQEESNNDNDTKDDDTKDEEPLKIILTLCGELGDKAFNDSSAHGLDLIKDKYGDKVDVKLVEMGFDEQKWEPGFLDAAESDADIIISGTWSMQKFAERYAPDYKDKIFILFDASPNYEENDLPNVYSMQYKQNEATFLAGALAASVTSSDMVLANDENRIGFIGGMDIPVINDFLVGYIKGAQYINSDIKVSVSYVGSWTDTAKGKELALAQYNQGADIILNSAGQAGLGSVDAAKKVQKYTIGGGADQEQIFKEIDPEKAELITTSVIKDVDISLLRAIDKYFEGTLKFNETETLGLKEGCVSIATPNKIVNQDIVDKINEIKSKIANGEIEVPSVYGMTTEQIDQLKNAVK